MTKKLVYITDTHGRGSNPLSRKDDFPQVLLSKLSWVCDFAKNIGASAIIHGGDWVETPDVANNYIRQMMKIVSTSEVHWYGILGNHDLYGQNAETFYKTPLGIAESSGAFTRLSENGTIIDDSFFVTGVDFNPDIDKEDKKYYTDSQKGPIGMPSIHVVHGFADDHEWPHGIEHTVISEIGNSCNADVILTGHIHSGYGIYKSENGTIFVNPNALARTTASVGDISNIVQVAIIELYDDGEINAVLHPLPKEIARPGEEVLDRERILVEKANKRQIASFVGSLKTDVKMDNSIFDIYKTLEVVSKENEVSENVFAIAKEQIAIAEEELKLSEGDK